MLNWKYHLFKRRTAKFLKCTFHMGEDENEILSYYSLTPENEACSMLCGFVLLSLPSVML